MSMDPGLGFSLAKAASLYNVPPLVLYFVALGGQSAKLSHELGRALMTSLAEGRWWAPTGYWIHCNSVKHRRLQS